MFSVSLSIDLAVCAAFPQILVTGFVADRLDVAAGALPPSRLDALWAAAREGARARGLRLETLAASPLVNDWRNAFAATGVKPGSFRGSVEAILRRVLKDGRLDTPLPIVTAYCAVSAIDAAPIGGYDADRLPERAIAVRHGDPERDRFDPLGGRAADMPITDRVVVYASNHTVICWSFNHRDSRETALRSETQRGVFFSEAVTPAQREATRIGLAHLRDLLAESGAATGPIAEATAERPTVEIVSATRD